MLKRVYIVIPCCLLIMTILSGCSILMPQEEDTLAPALVEPEKITYNTIQAKTGYIEDSFTCSGNFVPVNFSNLYFTAAGRLKSVQVKEGDAVTKGTVLAELLSEELDLQMKNQELMVKASQEAYDYYSQSTDIDVEIAQNRLKQVQASYDAIQKHPENYSTNETAKSEIDLQNEKLNLQKVMLDTSYQLGLKKNDLDLAQQKLEQLRAADEKNKLVSPIDGVVTFTADVKEGDYLDAYRIIVSVADPGKLMLEYRGIQSTNFLLDMKVQININGKSYDGKVVFIPSLAPAEERAAYSDTVRFEAANLPSDIKSGDIAEIKVIRASAENAVLVPRKAVKELSGENIVYVLEDGLRVEKYVETGVGSASEIQILSGVSTSDQIILE